MRLATAFVCVLAALCVRLPRPRDHGLNEVYLLGCACDAGCGRRVMEIAQRNSERISYYLSTYL